jgi:hypothetical protein
MFFHMLVKSLLAYLNQTSSFLAVTTLNLLDRILLYAQLDSSYFGETGRPTSLSLLTTLLLCRSHAPGNQLSVVGLYRFYLIFLNTHIMIRKEVILSGFLTVNSGTDKALVSLCFLHRLSARPYLINLF